MAKRIKRYNPQLRWIQIWGDPWSIDSTLDVMSKIRARRKEKQLLMCADKIIYISELTYHTIKSKYPNLSDKINYVPRSYCYEVHRTTRNRDKKIFDIVQEEAVYAPVLNRNVIYGYTKDLIVDDIDMNSIQACQMHWN